MNPRLGKTGPELLQTIRYALLAICLVAQTVSSFGQTGKSPYPIIFVHGLKGNETTWNLAVQELGGSAKVFDICLNHDANLATSLLSQDVNVIGWRDGAPTSKSPNRLYIINFDHGGFPASHSTHTQSSQSAIFKQGFALGRMIEAVTSLEQASKVILVGHSMGGLAIREYLQRGNGINWVDQSSTVGHKVARVVTIGTPHRGCNLEDRKSVV